MVERMGIHLRPLPIWVLVWLLLLFWAANVLNRNPADQANAQQGQTDDIAEAGQPSAGEKTVERTVAEVKVEDGQTEEPLWKEMIAAWKTEDAPEPADNSFCYVCHLNYEDEELSRIHQPAGIGCETCHGISDKHSADEDSTIPPDIMYPTAGIIPFCLACHEKEQLLDEEDHKDLFALDADPNKSCTDCHGKKHRLSVRTRKWNKGSGELIWDDGVRMMQERPRRRSRPC